MTCEEKIPHGCQYQCKDDCPTKSKTFLVSFDFADDVLSTRYLMSDLTALGGTRRSSDLLRSSDSVRASSAERSKVWRSRAFNLGFKLVLPFKSLEINQKIPGCLITLIKLFRERLHYNAIEFCGCLAIETCEWQWLFVEY